ncbi:hypothetical protein M513_11687, partial [Trichuris suis]
VARTLAFVNATSLARYSKLSVFPSINKVPPGSRSVNEMHCLLLRKTTTAYKLNKLTSAARIRFDMLKMSKIAAYIKAFPVKSAAFGEKVRIEPSLPTPGWMGQSTTTSHFNRRQQPIQ